MARVPTYTQPTIEARPLGAPQLSASVPAGAFDTGGSALVDGGKQLQDLGKGLAEMVQQRQKEETATKAAEASGVMTQWEITALHDPQTGVFARQGKAAEGSTAEIGKSFDDIFRKVREGSGITDKKALADLERQTLERKASILSTVDKHERTQMQRYRATLTSAAVDTAITGATDAYTDPAMVETRLGAAEHTLRANLTGQPEEEINRQVASLYSQGNAAVILRHLAEGDVDAARKWYSANRSGLTAADHLHVLGKLEPVVLDREARKIADGMLADQTGGDAANNPGNLMPGGTLAGFKTPEDGVAATVRNLQSYPDRFGASTLSAIAAKWAPAGHGDNDPAVWARNVGQMAGGIDPNAPLDLKDPDTLARLVPAIAKQEKGHGVAGRFSPAVVATGIEKALSGTPVEAIEVPPGPEREAALVAQARALPNARLGERVEAWVRSGLADQQRAEAQRQQQETEQSERSLSDLELRLMRGQADLPDIETAYDAGRGWLSPKDRTRLTAHQEERRRQQAEADADFARVGAAVSGLGTLDPRSDRDRKAVSDHFSALASGWRDLPEADQLDRMVQTATRYGMVPDPVRSSIRGALRRADQPAMVVQAADVIERLRHSNPDLLKDFSQDDLSLGNLVGTYAGAGLPPAEAVRLATEAAKVPEVERTARADSYASLLKDKPSASADVVRNALVGGWTARHLPLVGVPNVAPPPELVSEFDRVAEAEFTRHGNLDAARKTATDAVRRVWGVSSIGGLTPDGSGASDGARLMRHPPELFYGRSGLDAAMNGEWMREQLVADLKKSGGMFDESAGDLEHRFMLAPDPSRTDPTSGGPLYQVWLKSRDGSLSAVRGSDQRPVLWRPEWDTSPAADRQRQSIENMRAGRAFIGAGGLNDEINRAVVTAADPNMGAY